MSINTKRQPHHAELQELDADSGSEDFEEFVYLLSHDIRNSVRALLELPQWIREDLAATGHRIDGSLAESFDLMDTQTRRLDRMLVDLLAYSRIGRKQSVQSMNLAETIREIITELRPPKGFQITCDLDCMTVQMGEQDIFTLLTALISNAIKHHHKEGGIIQIKSWSEGRDCVIRVQDDGPGIPERQRERVFAAMTTLKPRDEVEGSGMGLPIVRKIVAVYGGRVSYGSIHDGSGTALEIRLGAGLSRI
ncbi:HAMP domain-containing sensor histidine kinase [Roseovarius sp. Pro17]|uniref:sensor histidine kinase n=1 Tax=Roseovarius sp. Pro17 TaxID=3108175 RepID=UPI002D787BDF|nr:HAMP domain-containing sensor histidine kinase [Roseovarius sp. Pro17]